MDYIYKKGIQDTEFGWQVQQWYADLYPKPQKRPIDWSMLDIY